MKKCFLPLTAAVLCSILTACSGIKYQGESLPPLSSDTPVKFYLASELDKMPGVAVLGTAEYTARPSLTSKDIRSILQSAARDEGANGIRIVFMEKIPDGEARKDQINNTGAPQWNVSDNSDTSLSYMKNTINYSDVRDKEKTIYKTFVKAEFLSVPETLQNVEPRR
ncbi:MAG: hypothetical protein IKO02_02055 [Lentisphaeria bacterium]|nr:hypothetical protein [Lentisphaeria bacterium]